MNAEAAVATQHRQQQHPSNQQPQQSRSLAAQPAAACERTPNQTMERAHELPKSGGSVAVDGITGLPRPCTGQYASSVVKELVMAPSPRGVH